MSLTMKVYIALVLSCASALGADTGIQVATTTSPTGAHHDGICKQDVFTRDGKTVLACYTFTENGAFEARVQTFFHDGSLVAHSVATPDSQDFVPEAGSQYSVSFKFHPSSEVEFVYISGKDGSLLDEFSCTNGVYFPAESHLISERNDAIKINKQAIELSQFLIAQ